MTETGGAGEAIKKYIDPIDALYALQLYQSALRRQDTVLTDHANIALCKFLNQFDAEYRADAAHFLVSFVTLSTRLEEMQAALEK